MIYRLVASVISVMPALTPAAVLEMDALWCLGILAAHAEATCGRDGGSTRGAPPDEMRADGSIARRIGGMDDLRTFLKQ